MKKTNRAEMMPKILFGLAATLALTLAACGPSATTPAPTSDTPAPAPKKVTMTQYEQIENGMTLAEVEAILGAGEEISSSEIAGITTNVVQWANPDFSAIVLTIQNGAVTSKSQNNLK